MTCVKHLKNIPSPSMKIFIYLFFILYSFNPVLAFTNECPSDQHWVKAHNRRGYYRANGTFVKATSISSHCRSSRLSDKYWKNKFEVRRPADWPYDQEKSKDWTVEEVERVLDAICELPEELWKKSDYKIYRMEKSKDGHNPATSSTNILVLYDSAFNKGKTLSRILAHEFAHEIYGNLDVSDAKGYRLTTNWFEVNKNGRRILISRKDGFVTDDGRVSPEEDFANNIEFFLFNQSNLRSKTPHAYRWIVDHFGDKFKLRKCEK